LKEMMRGRPVAATTARAAVSLASDPEWPSHTRPAARFGTIDSSFSASSTAGKLALDR
jgi:hypothetical protein